MEEQKGLFVIFGATGDLTTKKIFPALFNLIKRNILKDNFAIVGVSRRPYNRDEYWEFMKDKLSKDIETREKLRKKTYYFECDFSAGGEEERFKLLPKFLEAIRKKEKAGNTTLFYLSVMSQFFEPIIKNLSKNGLISKENSLHRVVFEKPLGFNLEDARKLNKSIESFLNEKQIYRIDHYLGKEIVQNIFFLRFKNHFFEPVWNGDYIDSVQINLLEDFCCPERLEFYDNYGVVKDVVQNHILQLLSLVAMNKPEKFEENYIRSEKIKILKKIKIEDFILGQFIGYDKFKKREASKTPTFAAGKFKIEDKKWKNVPFYFRTGKNLKEKSSYIHIKFKKELVSRSHLNKNIFKKDSLIIQIQPNEGIFLQLNGKASTTSYHKCVFGIDIHEAYEKLLVDIIRGDKTNFLSFNEIEKSWEIVAKMIDRKVISYYYKIGSEGPKESNLLITKEGKTWEKGGEVD